MWGPKLIVGKVGKVTFRRENFDSDKCVSMANIEDVKSCKDNIGLGKSTKSLFRETKLKSGKYLLVTGLLK